jgi:hypothetical protein
MRSEGQVSVLLLVLLFPNLPTCLPTQPTESNIKIRVTRMSSTSRSSVRLYRSFVSLPIML